MHDRLKTANAELLEKKALYDELTDRINNCTENIERLERESNEKKAERQSALAYGKDVSKLTAQLGKNGTAIEEYQDAIVGIKNRQEELNPEIEELKEKIYDMNSEIKKGKLIEISKRYNDKANELAEIVREFWNLYDDIHHRKSCNAGVYADDIHSGALSKIPVLNFAGNNYPNKKYFFELYYFRNYERRSK